MDNKNGWCLMVSQKSGQTDKRLRGLQLKKMQGILDANTSVASNVKGKLSTLLRILTGKRLTYEKMIVLKTSTQTSPVYLAARAWLEAATKVNVRLAGDSDISGLDRFEKFRGGKACERLKAGDLCFIAEKNGKIVSYAWVCFREGYVAELERKIRVNSNSAYGYDEYTDPDYRGKGILPTVLLSVSDYLFRNGIKEIYELVAFNNFPSLRSHRKIGAQGIGEVTLSRSFKLRRYRCKGVTPDDFNKLKEMFQFSANACSENRRKKVLVSPCNLETVLSSAFL